MAGPRGFKLAGRGRRQIKGSIGGGRKSGNLTGRSVDGDLVGTPVVTTPPVVPPNGPTIPPYVKDPTDPTLFRDGSGAFTTKGWVSVPGGRVYVLPGDTMSEAIGQGKGLITMAQTESSRGSGGAYTRGGYTRTGQAGNLSVARVRAGDTRSEVIGAARSAARSATSRAAAQSNARMNFAASERTGVGVRPSGTRAVTSTSAGRGGSVTRAGVGKAPATSVKKATATKAAAAKKPATKPATVVKKNSTSNVYK